MSETDTQNQQGTQEQATETEANTTQTTEPDLKAEAEKWKALARKNEQQAKANSAAAKELEKIRESQKSAEELASEKATASEQRASSAEAEAARLRVALRKGLTETQAKRLIGEDEESLEKDADELLASFAVADDDTAGDLKRRPQERLRSGAVPKADDPKTPEQAHQEFIAGVLGGHAPIR